MREKAARILAIAVGVIFVFSALSKLVAIDAFEVLLVSQGLASGRHGAAYLGRMLIGAELFLGIGLCQRALLRRMFMPATVLMLVGFSVYLAYVGFIQGSAEDCGCFGGVLEMSPLSALVKNIAMLAMLGYTWFNFPPDPGGRWEMVGALGACALAGVFLFFPPRAPDETTAAGGEQDSRFVMIQQLADSKGFDLLEGEALVALLSPDCDHCAAVASQLGEFARIRASAPPVYFVFLGEEELVPEFLRITETDFPHVMAPPNVFLQLIGNAPPRVYRLLDGRVVDYWDEEQFNPQRLEEIW